MSWPTKKLGEICDINGGNAAPQDYSVFSEDGIPFVRMQDLGRYHITDNFTETRDRIKREAISKLRIKIFPKGSIILPRSGSVFANHRAILGIDAAVVSHIAILNNYRGVHPRYFFWYLTKLDIGRHAVKTSNVDSISFQRLGKFEIPLPPLEIQKQIVERLDKIVGAQKLNDGLIQKADELFQSLLYKELNPSGEKWEEKEIADIAEARSGFGFPLDLQGDKNGGLPFYKVSDMNIVGNEIEMKSHNNSISVAKGEKLKYKPAPAGSVIFPKIGAAVATNKKRILVRDSLYDNNVMALIPNKLIDPNFLYFWLIKFDISQWASQSMPPSIRKTAVEKYKISIPSLETQKQIVAKLSAVQDYKTQLLAQKSKLKELFDSVLARSMKGEIAQEASDSSQTLK